MIQPVTAVELANFRKQVLKGIKQVTEELAMAERHGTRVARNVEYRGDPTDLTFTPLVLVDTGVASGVKIDGVPVLDTSLLEEYLASGTLSFIFESPGPADSPLETITLYHDQHEAEANLQVYVSSPPTERLRQLRTKKIRVYPRDWGFGTIIYERFEVSECRTPTQMQIAVDLVRREWTQNCTGIPDL